MNLKKLGVLFENHNILALIDKEKPFCLKSFGRKAGKWLNKITETSASRNLYVDLFLFILF